MRKCLILFFALAAGAVHAAPAWRWVDANGQVHYSDTPVPGATQVELSGAQTFGSTSRQQSAPDKSSNPASSARPTAPAQTYRAFNIVSPMQQETLWNVGTVVNVQVDLDPPLQSGHFLDMYVDGQLRNLNSTATSLTLDDLYRGVHTIQAVVVDGSGAQVVRSLATTFMIQQTSVQNPNNDSSVKPQPPRPTPVPSPMPRPRP